MDRGAGPDLTAGTVSKSYALDHLLPKHVAHAHQSGDIHFHDLDYHPFQNGGPFAISTRTISASEASSYNYIHLN
ncbi:anaerobic ribonucleoside-triphosphate reductase [Micromonospora chersina]